MIIVNGELYSPQYLLNAELFFIPVFIIVLIYRIRYTIKRRLLHYFKELVIFSYTYYVYRMLKLTIFPIFWFVDRTVLPAFGQAIYFEGNPFRIYFEFNRYGLYNIIGNVLLFFPMGFYLALFIKKCNLWKILLYLFSITLIIECIQLIMTYFYFGNRLFDVNDLVCNMIGGLLGYAIYCSAIGKWVNIACDYYF